MKKVVFVLFLICIQFAFSQKKKTTSSKSVLGKAENVSAEIITDKKQKKLVLFVTNGTTKDTLEVKKIVSTFEPLNFSLSSFTTNGVKLYIVHWEEKNKIVTKLKKVDQNSIENQIWNIDKKELLIGNTQKKSHIVETVYLDKNKTASETQEKKRNEGFEFTLLPNGDVILKNKTQQDTYVYNAASFKYEIKKGASKRSSSSSKRR